MGALKVTKDWTKVKRWFEDASGFPVVRARHYDELLAAYEELLVGGTPGATPRTANGFGGLKNGRA